MSVVQVQNHSCIITFNHVSSEQNSTDLSWHDGTDISRKYINNVARADQHDLALMYISVLYFVSIGFFSLCTGAPGTKSKAQPVSWCPFLFRSKSESKVLFLRKNCSFRNHTGSASLIECLLLSIFHNIFSFCRMWEFDFLIEIEQRNTNGTLLLHTHIHPLVLIYIYIIYIVTYLLFQVPAVAAEMECSVWMMATSRDILYHHSDSFF